MLNELHSDEMLHTLQQPVLKIPTSSPLWLKYLRLISSLLADCFHITCTINSIKQLSCHHHHQSTELYSRNSIRHLAFIPVLQIDNVNHLFQTPLSEEFSAFHPAVDILRRICDKTTATEKLLIIYQTFATVDQIISKSKPCRNRVPTSLDEVGNCRNPSICSVDTLSHLLPGLDQLLLIIQFVVIWVGVMYLGAELAYIEQLSPEHLSLIGGGLLPYLMTTLQACYDQILREGLQFTIQF
uniref:VPS9 domain-containing protein n=1 Tax=Trichobilharzia regenti TaxID=157069 RepID=A0AA85IMP0_TRIRE|nr:unnamed protein product [Trichobilharzia regenti]